MNAKQRRIKFRELSSSLGKGKPVRVSTWEDLLKQESETHFFVKDDECESVWVHRKDSPDEYEYYLSTHTFHPSRTEQSTIKLLEMGFNVKLVS